MAASPVVLAEEGPLLTFPLPTGKAQLLSITALYRSIEATPELSRCEIMSMDRYVTMQFGFPHRSLFFQVLTSHSGRFWVRLDRRWPLKTSIWRVVGPGGVVANDQVGAVFRTRTRALIRPRPWLGKSTGSYMIET